MTILSVNDGYTIFLNEDGDYACYIHFTQDILPVVLDPVCPPVDDIDCPL